MSGAIFGASGLTPHGLLGPLVTEALLARARLDRLTSQAASGRVADDFAGLGVGARVVLDYRPMLEATSTWQANIDAATTRMDVTRNAMERLTAIASDFYARINNLNGMNAIIVDTTAAAARDALREVAALLNAKAGDVYVFAGTDTATAPLPDGDAILNSGFYTQIATSVAGLSGAGPAATVAAILAIASSNASGTSPFSAFLSQPAASLQAERPLVQVGEKRYEATGILASANAVVFSTGSSTTGSYVRDLMRALATLGSLSSSQISDPGFTPLIDDTRTSLRDAIAAMSADTGVLGDAQVRLQGMHRHMEGTAIALTRQIATLEDADMALVASQISLTQVLLQSSYRMISSYGELSLAKFLS